MIFTMCPLISDSRKVYLIGVCAFLLASCGTTIEIDATDLSAVAVESDRTAIEKSIGQPINEVETNSVTVAAYKFDWGSKVKFRDPHLEDKPIALVAVVPIVGEMLLIAALAAERAHQTAEARSQQEGILAAVFDASGKLAFVRHIPPDIVDVKPELIKIADQFIAAQSGDRAAAYNLGSNAFLPQQMRTYLTAAANKGHGEAAYDLGKAYQLGAGFTQNDELAFDWFMKAAQLKHSPAYISVAWAYRSGNGVLENKFVSERWFEKAAAAGSIEAQRMLSELRREDENARFQALLRRAEAGQREFQIEVAEGYRYGTLTTKDVQQAVHWYARAAASGDDFAPYALGSMYEEGETGNAHPSLAYIWYGVAERVSADSAEDLQIRRERIKGSIPAEDIEWADSIVEQWPNQIDASGINGDPLAPLLKDSPSSKAQQLAEVEKAAETARLLSEWQARADMLRKEIAKSHPETLGGFFQITEFEVVNATKVNRSVGWVRLATRYTISPPQGARNLPEPSSYRRIIIVDNRLQKVVDVQKATKTG